jgi:hypothetical protein
MYDIINELTKNTFNNQDFTLSKFIWEIQGKKVRKIRRMDVI